ncbi:hypothetical protein RhiirA5_432664 [Rhizophagus irregularis]|uniref:Uncharacterized protein n=1 Tax=Rhizophagus irregularis TaxID=588596 RepID=A0A2N0NSY4_9GLOM|nr:hypothetical protein RhiirA5_432664 [Rhizophagus irregularis]
MSAMLKAYAVNYWNDLADSLANSAYIADSAIHISQFEYTYSHDYVLLYDNLLIKVNS